MSPVPMLNFKVIWKHYDFAANQLAPPTPAQAAALAGLAADPAFDPGDYHGKADLSHARFARCKVCRTFGAPRRVCGYCRSRVRALRDEMVRLGRPGRYGEGPA